ncbi:hypothetical protein LAZ67_6000683 [Cordylochernes scorpioides]|uniref:Beta-N-acetylhexosaminidase n=1 Tax=Cordylochernes scorpioides TaxID=51811 RepID=A0ABY6KIT5_9ARAC|nr:hypothetical protein LAZ67_6000683 [Cordylochernes scorpioides]
MYQLDAPLSPLTYHFAVLPERCTYWECQADLCKAHTIFPPSANNTQYAHFSDNTSTTQGLTQPPHHVQSKNFFRANCSYYRVKVPEQPPNANLSHPTKVQTDHLHHTPKHPHSTHHSMYHTHHPTSPEHLPGIPIDNQPQPPYPPQFPALLRQYQHVFSRNKFAVPCLKVPPVRIATNSDKVVTIRPYRVPICDQREIRSQIRQMLDNDIIEPSYSPFSSPVTLVTKRDKTKRFCIDYRKVNEVISSDVHPLPRIEDILDRLARAKYFSTADVSSAYWQVPIHPDSRPLLAFATIDGLYQPTRLPFGLKTSPQIYERAINQVLQGHGLDCVAHYFDDFVIYSETLEEHQEHLRKFFAFCDAENLQLNLTKCEFFRQTIEFLGYTITAGTTTPLIRNTDVIHAIPPPNNRKTLQSFLGAVNVYNKFIPDYARLRTPLNNLLKKDVTWDWDDKCQKAFTSLKESLTKHPVLHLYKDELPCQVYCDASTLGIAGVLKQVHSAGKAYPVQYFSRALRVHERNYTISELECLAIVESVEKFRVYLMGRKFTIFSDHHALQWLKTIKNPSGRLFRWSLRLSCYEYEVRYIKGSLQHEADLLSRNPFCGFLDATIIKNHQLTPSGESKLTIDRNGLQTLKRRGVTKIVVPDALVPDLLTKVHSRYNHPGISQMTRLISTQYYWKGMSEDISKTTKACAICQSTKHPRGPTFGELGQLPVATQPFDLVALDTIAGLAKYGNAKTYLHVVVDHFSRYTWTFPSKSTSLTTYQQVIKRVLQDGSPKRLLTDRAPAFTSPKFRKFLINRNIHPLLTTSNNPQANGLCERLNATLTGKLRLLHLENPKAAWTKLAKRVTVVYNNTPHSVTGFPPGYLMFDVLPPELTEHVNPYPVLTTARRIAHERTQAKHLKDKHAYDQQHKTPHFEPGDLVLVKVYHHPNTGKLAPYFTGPYEILEIISPNVEELPEGARLVLYADDQFLIIEAASRAKAEKCVEASLQILSNWAHDSGLKFNVSKTKALSFKPRDIRSKRKEIKWEHKPAIRMKGRRVVMGVVIDDKMGWQYQAEEMVARGREALCRPVLKIWENREDALGLEPGALEWKRDPRKPPQWLPKWNWSPGGPTGIGTVVLNDGTELVAIRVALRVCAEKNFSPDRLYSDCMSALVAINLVKGQLAHQIIQELEMTTRAPELYWASGLWPQPRQWTSTGDSVLTLDPNNLTLQISDPLCNSTLQEHFARLQSSLHRPLATPDPTLTSLEYLRVEIEDPSTCQQAPGPSEDESLIQERFGVQASGLWPQPRQWTSTGDSVLTLDPYNLTLQISDPLCNSTLQEHFARLQSSLHRPLATPDPTLTSLEYLRVEIEDPSTCQQAPGPSEDESSHTPFHVYTEDMVKQIVHYAESMGIRVVPEFNVPGGAGALSKSHPELTVTCGDGKTILKPESSEEFLEKLFANWKVTFNTSQFHVGLSGFNLSCWESQDHNGSIADHFAQSTVQSLLNNSMVPIIWGEAIAANISVDPEAIVQLRTREKDLMSTTLSHGHSVIVSSCWHLSQPYTGQQMWQDFYVCRLNASDGGNGSRVLGGEVTYCSCLVDGTNLISTIWPAASAVAERLWSNPEDSNSMEEVTQRLQQQRCLMLK